MQGNVDKMCPATVRYTATICIASSRLLWALDIFYRVFNRIFTASLSLSNHHAIKTGEWRYSPTHS